MSRPRDPRKAVEWRLFDDAAAMARRVADDVQSITSSAIEARGSAVIALPGGRTPVPIFEELAGRRLDWSPVTLLPTDDRLVPIGDRLSNAGLIRAHLAGTGARLLTLVDGEVGVSIADAGRSADRKLAALRWPLDLIWLGMGEDGHTASILPGPDFDEALLTGRRACGVTPDPLPAEAPVARVTLTRAALVATRFLMLTITGEEKRAVADRAIGEGPQSSLAIGRVLASARVPVEICWSR